jgi:acyl transferase domain-containing protein/NADPH:quinone reductase-like Zn-dependent oxidoreductase/NADP-dependent 3-hydroxy acid dehydrogenase YdfG
MSTPLTPLQQAFIALQDAERRSAAAEAKLRAPVAIVGLACRAPGGVRDAESFWRLLEEGRDAIGPVSNARWDHDALYDPDPNAAGKIITRSAGLVADVDQFDAEFFGISPREADGMDPQQRMLLEVCWEALENAGLAPDRLQHTATGVYVGAASADYAYMQLRDAGQGLGSHFASGVAHSVLSGRVSYLLGLQGPSLTIDTACSSSLVAVHLACQALRNGECRLALAGGVNLILSPDIFIALSQARMLAPDGRCKTFGSGADGFGRGEGCGMVALKLLADAEEDGDRVLAVIRGSAINQDGPSSGLTVPNGPAQESVISAALTQAQIEPQQVSYVEAHGTGTELGDPLEARAVSAALCGRRASPLLIGSVKSNIGHLEGAAGVIGLIKLVLSLQRGVIPRSLHCDVPSPHIAWEELALRVVADKAALWPDHDDRRIGGVSSFGFSGTNAHLIVEAARSAVRASDTPRAQLLPVSGQTAEALATYAGELRDAVTADLRLADVARTLGPGRAHREHRAIMVADTISAFRDGLDALTRGRDEAANVRSAVVPHRDPPRIAFLFTGQGAQYPGMAAELYRAMPAFRMAFDRCDVILTPLLGASLRDTVLQSSDAATLAQTGLAQPALFALEYALAEMFRSVGVTPVAVMGHSVGELVAACVAGAVELPDALRLVAARGALMQALPAGGAMAAVFAPESSVAKAVAPHAAHVSIAALNGPMQTVISGEAHAVSRICAVLVAEGIKTQPLMVSHAFHSPLVEPAMAPFEQEFSGVKFAAPQLAVISNVTGQRLDASELASPQYWSRHLRAPVRFADGLATLAGLNVDICVELGPQPTLTTFAAGVFTNGGPRVMPTLRRGTDDRRAVLDVLGELYLAGVEIDWRGLDPDRAGRPVSLPTSPFVRRRHWFRNKVARGRGAYEHPLLGRRVRAAVRDLVLFEAELDAESADFIADHVVQGRVIMPAAGMIEMALSAWTLAGGADKAALQSMMIAAPLSFEGGPRLVQTLIRMKGARPVGFEILSSAAEGADKAWLSHAQGDYVVGEIGAYQAQALPSGAREISASAHYDILADRGLAFGNSLRLVQRVRAAPNVALGEIVPVASSGYALEPALMDAWIQVMAAAAPEGAGETYLPVSIDRLSYARAPVGATESRVAISPAQSNLLRADVLVSDAEGIVMHIKGIALRPVRSAGTSDLYRVEWREASETAKDASWAPTPDTLAAGLGPQLHALAQVHRRELDAYQISFVALESASVQWILRMFAALGWRPSQGERTTAGELAWNLGIASRYRQLLRRYLEILTEEGILRREGEQYSMVRWPARDGEIGVSDPHEPRTAIAMACAEHLSSIVTEREDPLQYLFPNGSAALAERLYRESPEAKLFNTLLAETVARVVAEAPVGRRVRILEVGAGTGGSTAYVAALLKDANVDYVFTDLGAAFVARAQESFSAYPFLSFSRFDLEAAPEAQGLAHESFDIVIASNCVHATADLKQTLAHLRDLLAPGGLLLLLEVTGFERWIDLTFALTEGWWRFSDPDLRPDYPLLDPPRWKRLLEDVGFAAAVIGERLPTSRQALVAARKPIGVRAQKVALIGGTQALRQDLATSLMRRGHVVSPEEALDASIDLVAYLGFLAVGQDDPLNAMRTALAPLLAVIRRLGAQGGGTRLALVTRGAAAVGDIAPIQAAAVGFARTASAELAELRPTLVDLDPARAAEEQMDALVSALLSPGAEAELALRDDAVLSSRLTRVSAVEPAQMHLQCGGSGVLDDLVLVAAQRAAPGPGQLEVRVTASSVNFRDVMNALGMRRDAEPLGSECAGAVSAVGPGVEGFAIGEAVIAVASGAFASYVLCEAYSVVKQPRGWTDGQAAALLLATMTAQHALVDVAQLRPGQTVLIHAGAGGVGMAAVQIAKRCGARIFATAGTEEKRSLLGELGAARTFSSRTLEFEREIAIATDGRGVDVVLNSLAGPFIEASVRCLAVDGVFLEIGKSEIWSQARFRALLPGARYAPLDLATMPTSDRATFERLLRTVMADAESGALKPPPVRVFPLTRAKDAFSFMAHARHVGKIVLRHEGQVGGTLDLDPDGLYLVTGAYGGIGLAAAERLFERGARGLALIGRTSPGSEVRAKLDAWISAGAQILELIGDISLSSTITDVFARIDASGRPLRGVIHSAGALSDGALLQQDWARFEPPLHAKVRGAWLLHQHTKARRLDFFGLFSSVAATFGAPGQANHAVSNAFMDGLAHYRREQGLPATSIAWGAWSKLGAAAARGADARAEATGVGVITPARGLDALEALLANAPAHVVVMPVDWSAFLAHRSEKPPAFYADVTPARGLRAPARWNAGSNAVKDVAMLQRLQEAVPSMRHELLTSVVAAAARHVLGVTGEVDHARPLSELGLDSLLAVELRNRLGTSLSLSPGLPATVVFDCPTVDLLAAHLMTRLWPAEQLSPQPEATAALVSVRVAEEVDNLSEAEIDAMFDRMVRP